VIQQSLESITNKNSEIEQAAAAIEREIENLKDSVDGMNHEEMTAESIMYSICAPGCELSEKYYKYMVK